MSLARLSKLSLLGIGLAMLPGCPLLDVQADAQEVCLSYPNLHVPAGGGQTQVQQSFTFDDLSQIHDLTDKVDANVELTRAAIHATSGISDFSFIKAMHLTVSSGDAGSTLPALELYNCDGDCAPNGATLELPAAKAQNVVAYLKGDAIKIDLGFTGEIPTTEWTMDVDVCMKAKASYTLSP
ncbi:MAG TPA: hypothetical protein VGC42_06975 [Kofleriaceae bacterium]